MPEPELPVSSLNEALPYLRRPFTPEAVKFKIQTVFKEAKGCIVVAYIDARLVIERLNMVVGADWSATYRGLDGQPTMLWCGLTVFDTTRSDVGEGQGVTDPLKRKAAVSDALKRAAVHFGVGVSVYALPQIVLMANQPHVERFQGTKGGPSLRLTEVGHTKLREGYAKWLAEKNTFGDPLDHGDVEGQTLDEDEVNPLEEFVPVPPPPADSENAQRQTELAKEMYANDVDHKVLPPARFNAMLSGVLHSEEELERFITYLGALRKPEAVS